MARALKSGSKWREFGITDASGSPKPHYISGDKSPREIRREIQTKRLHSMFGEARPELSWRCQRSRGLIAIEAVPVCELLVGGSHAEPTQISWNPDVVRRFNIDIERF